MTLNLNDPENWQHGINKYNYGDFLIKFAESNNKEGIEFIIKNFNRSYDLYFTSLQAAIKAQAPEALKTLLDVKKFSLAQSGKNDKARAIKLFELAGETEDCAIWKILCDTNEKTSYGKLDLEEIDKIKERYIRFELIDKETFSENKHISKNKKLTLIFNFKSCQQTTVFEKTGVDAGVTMHIQNFNDIQNPEFIEEMYQKLIKLGGEAKPPSFSKRKLEKKAFKLSNNN